MLLTKLKISVHKQIMTSIFKFHNHQNKVKQHPFRRSLYLGLLLSVAALPMLSRQVFASSISITSQLYVDGQVMNVASNAKTVQEVIDAAGIKLNQKDLVEPSLDTEITDGFKINVFRSSPITIEDGANKLQIETAQKSAEGITKEAGIVLHPEDDYKMLASDISEGDFKPGLTLKLDRAEVISLNLYGAVTEQRTQTSTVQEFLDQNKIALQPGDILVQSPNEAIRNGMTIQVRNDSREVQVVDEEIPMPVETIKDVNKDTSYKEVKIAGSAGSKKVTYEIKKENGIEVSRIVLEEVIIKPASKQTVIVGAKKVASAGANVSAQAKELMAQAGIPESQWSSAYSLIQKESGWNSGARNRSSGACGLVQAYPCSKLGPNWSDPLVALRWGNSYVNGRYGGWNQAWAHSQRKGWY